MKQLFHFSLTPPHEIDGTLKGWKFKHKNIQRKGQKTVDEEFEKIRKEVYSMNKPSLFTSLWVTDKFDPKIANKKFIDHPDMEEGYLYRVTPESEPVAVNGRAEVQACQFYAWKASKLGFNEVQLRTRAYAINFWENTGEKDHNYVQDYLIAGGARIIDYQLIGREQAVLAM